MNVEEIVDILVEGGASDFVGTLPDEFWDTFHIVNDRDHNVYARKPYEGCSLVYRDIPGTGTRDFLGYIYEVNCGPNMPTYWVVKGVSRPRKGRETKVQNCYSGKQHATAKGAAAELSAAYRRYNVR